MSQILVAKKTVLRGPRVPNFIMDNDGKAHSVGDLSNDDLRAIGTAWTTDLLNHAERIRKNKKK